MQSIYAGVDPSLNGTGIAFAKGCNVIASDTLKPPNHYDGVRRLMWLRDATWHFINAYRPVAVCIEGYSYGSKNSRHHSTGEWGGVLRLALWELETQLYVLPPKSLKKFATGNGNIAGKAPMGVALKRLAGVDLRGKEDEVDAALLALAVQEQCGDGWLRLSDNQRDALEKLEYIGAKRVRRAR